MNRDLRHRDTHHGKAEHFPREDSRPPCGHRNGGARTEEFSSEFSAAFEFSEEERVETSSRKRLAYKRRSLVVIKRSRSESIRSDHSDP